MRALITIWRSSRLTLLAGKLTDQYMPLLVTSKNPDVALPLCYLSAALIGILGIVAVVYNLRQTSVRRPKAV